MRSGRITSTRFATSVVHASRLKDWGVHILLYAICGMLSRVSWTGQDGKFWDAYLIILGLQVPAYLAAYLLNDVADYDTDIHRTTARGRPSKGSVARSAVLALAVYCIAAAIVLDPLPLALALLTGLVAILYSLPPFRLKTRGVLGVIVAASFQRLPFFLMLVLETGGANIATLLIATWLLGTGFLFIVHHQCEDAEHDRRSGAKTWIARRGIAFGSRICVGCSVMLALLPFVAWAHGSSAATDASTHPAFLFSFAALTALTLLLFDIRYGRRTRARLRGRESSGMTV